MRRRRILVTTSPAYGHALPMLPLLRAARAAGHEVLVATGPDFVPALRERGLDAAAAGPVWSDMWRRHVEASERAPADVQHLVGVATLFGDSAAERLTDLEPLARRWKPDVVVHEMLELAGPVLADRLGVPAVVHGFGPLFPFYEMIAGAVAERPGLEDVWGLLSAEECVDVTPPSLHPDGPTPWPGARPLRPSAGEPGGQDLPDEVRSLLADGDAVYFTLGTVLNTAGNELAAGIEALAGLGRPVLVTTGPDVDPDALAPVPDHVLAVRFLPQARVLPEVDLVVSQCGAGIMLGALANGTAQVALPRGADQPMHAQLVERAGAGVAVPPPLFGVDAIRDAAQRVLGDPSFATAAAAVRAEIEAMPAPAEVAAELWG
ncbi:glycosyltransferase [uncultured Phycicoccus sp.]|uniref:glycosyltransferase n=1 Tax=uncultured Phycicoccus sp. TaxID=661422 RepID=UPI0026253574|nr:glycosyltransferase [uncultured Phycicoccus sp.]